MAALLQTQEKIKTFEDLEPILRDLKLEGKKIVHCHGVFDLLHPGHLRHLQEAKQQGDLLVVSITPDRFVNKGPGRPVFTEALRLEQLAAIALVDYVVLNDSPDAVSAIKKLRPSLYVKGIEYHNHHADITGKISTEAAAVEEVGGSIYYTDDLVFSSSSLINRFLDSSQERVQPFIDELKKKCSLQEILDNIEALSTLNVLVIGDAIIDEYQYVEPLGQSGKGVHMTALCKDRELFLGGSLIIANHLSNFAKQVTLLSAINKECPHLPFIHSSLHPHVTPKFLYSDLPTLIKKRYLSKDGKSLTKLFETYSVNEPLVGMDQTEEAIRYLQEETSHFDLVLVCDFGNGFTNPYLIEAISQLSNFLAINTQTNGGNRGYNVITHYPHADFISVNEPELRLAAHDRYSSLERVAQDISGLLECPQISITRGVQGVYYYTAGETISIPAMTSDAVDRVGAGDSYFALAALCASKGYSPWISGFIGSVAAALDVQIVGNREAIQKVNLCKYVTRLFK